MGRSTDEWKRIAQCWKQVAQQWKEVAMRIGDMGVSDVEGYYEEMFGEEDKDAS